MFCFANGGTEVWDWKGADHPGGGPGRVPWMLGEVGVGPAKAWVGHLGK